jgi:hypothetical protein
MVLTAVQVNSDHVDALEFNLQMYYHGSMTLAACGAARHKSSARAPRAKIRILAAVDSDWTLSAPSDIIGSTESVGCLDAVFLQSCYSNRPILV